MTVRPGTVLTVRTGSVPAFLIRLGAAFTDAPNMSNHVAVVTHTDPKGTVWCMEGRPGGVGPQDATAYLTSKWTLTNADQPFTAAQGAVAADTMNHLLDTPYDWEAIAADAAAVLRITLPGWDPTWKGTVPGHVVCSSLAAYAYGKAGIPHPAGMRACTPASWDSFILTKAWETTPASQPRS